jgi:glucokinase
VAGDRAGRHFIGVDLGGTHLRVARVDGVGAILAGTRVRTDREGGPLAVAAQIEQLVASLRDDVTVAVGVGIPGAFDRATGTVLGIPALPGWAGMNLVARLQDSTGLPCILENDATAAAIGEWRAGAGQGCAHFVYITISTGIGAGVIVDGRVLLGARGLAGEIGHCRIADASDPCSCGQIGCWEAVASGTALGRRAARVAEADPTGLMARLAAGGQVTAAHVGQAARAGDARALELLAEEAVWLGYGLVNAQHLYAPERIVIGGGLSILLDLMADEIAAVVRDRTLPGFPEAPILRAALGDDAGTIGAALQAGLTY